VNLAARASTARGWLPAFTIVLVAGVVGRLLFLGDKSLKKPFSATRPAHRDYRSRILCSLLAFEQ